MKDTNHAYNTGINDILLTSLGLALEEWAGMETVAINLEGHGREAIFPDVDISRTVGWFTAQYPVVLDMKEVRDISYAIRHVKETLRRVPQKGIGYGILKYLVPSGESGMTFRLKPEIRFNYMGQLEGHRLNNDDGNGFVRLSHIPTGSTIGEGTAHLEPLAIDAVLTRGSLEIAFTADIRALPYGRLRTLSVAYRSQLLRIIEHCAARRFNVSTPSDLGCSDVSIFQLEDINRHLDTLVQEDAGGKGRGKWREPG